MLLYLFLYGCNSPFALVFRERQRLQALKENDEEAYIRLLNETKNERLQLLLRQTDAYLEKISNMVQSQKTRDDIADRKKEMAKKLQKQQQNKEKAEGAPPAEGGAAAQRADGASQPSVADEGEAAKGKGELEGAEQPAATEAAVEGEKKNAAAAPAGEQDIRAEDIVAKNQKYYGMAHTILEDIPEQPSLLQGGQLKHYQVRVTAIQQEIPGF